MPAVEGPLVMVVTVTGLFIANVSKSSLSWHTVEAHLQMVKLHEDPLDMSEEVKYVEFSDEDVPHDFSK